MVSKREKLSAEHKRKISETMRKKWQEEGYREKMSESVKGKKLTKEHRRKISRAMKKQHKDPKLKEKRLKGWRRCSRSKPHHNKGRKLGKYHREAISRSLKGKNMGRKLSEERKKKISRAMKRYWAERKKREKLEPETKLEKTDLEGRFCVSCQFFKEKNNGVLSRKDGFCSNPSWRVCFEVFKSYTCQYFSEIVGEVGFLDLEGYDFSRLSRNVVF